jgi:quercetin dioxygenase-like cupin family protein
MIRTLFALAAGIGVGVAGMTLAQHAGPNPAQAIAEQDIIEKLDGKETKVTFVEVTYEAGQAGKPHRHPGPVFGYVLEGEFEFAINDQPAKVLKAGETFYEPTGCVHRVTKNASSQNRTRVLAVILHPRDAKQIAIPEAKQE